MKHWESGFFDDLEVELVTAAHIIAAEPFETRHLIAGSDEPVPRVVAWSHHPEGLLVETPKAQFIITPDDEDGLARLAAMIRIEFCAGSAGIC